MIKYKVFISYAHSDKDWVIKFSEDLRRPHCDIWFDRDLIGGENWLNSILEHIEECNCFICILSRNYLKRPYCLGELSYAYKLNKAILPILVEDCELPPFLETIQYISLSKQYLDEVGYAFHNFVLEEHHHNKYKPPILKPKRPTKREIESQLGPDEVAFGTFTRRFEYEEYGKLFRDNEFGDYSTLAVTRDFERDRRDEFSRMYHYHYPTGHYLISVFHANDRYTRFIEYQAQLDGSSRLSWQRRVTLLPNTVIQELFKSNISVYQTLANSHKDEEGNNKYDLIKYSKRLNADPLSVTFKPISNLFSNFMEQLDDTVIRHICDSISSNTKIALVRDNMQNMPFELGLVELIQHLLLSENRILSFCTDPTGSDYNFDITFCDRRSWNRVEFGEAIYIDKLLKPSRQIKAYRYTPEFRNALTEMSYPSRSIAPQKSSKSPGLTTWIRDFLFRIFNRRRVVRPQQSQTVSEQYSAQLDKIVSELESIQREMES